MADGMQMLFAFSTSRHENRGVVLGREFDSMSFSDQWEGVV
jgi:hypothetical protein